MLNGSVYAPPPIEVAVGIDEPQIRAVLSLWADWAEEEGIETYDERRLAMSLARRIHDGVWMPVVAWAGEFPVGMVEVMVLEDPFSGDITAYGDHAYLAEGYRGQGAFDALVQGAIFIAEVLGATVQILPVGTKTRFLMPLYERYGFETAGYVMRRKV